ncbi:uncharacterized protein [Miscanthus floridulus]|uniref:uncharacterized protein n=1 Tax=Miscanthus floridulus TaxID=154761 RepID=UPI003458B05B
MYTGQFVYCGHHVTLSIGDVLPLRRILEGTVICNVENHTVDGGAPPPGTTPSSSAATPTTASGQGASTTKGRPQQATVRTTTLGTLQCSSSFKGSDPFLAKATRTISSMLDNL